jgi:septal ring-binding cell division protein DamX
MKRERRNRNDQRHGEDWPRLLKSAALLGAVLGVLLLGAALRTEPPRSGTVAPPLPPVDADVAEPTPHVRAAEPEPPRGVEPTPPARGTAAPRVAETASDPLVDRAAGDLERFAQAEGAWTAQLHLLCDRERVEGLLERFGHHSAFHVIPTLYEGRPCFRLCWNRYDTRDEARSASDMPAALRDVQPRPTAKSIREVLE